MDARQKGYLHSGLHPGLPVLQQEQAGQAAGPSPRGWQREHVHYTGTGLDFPAEWGERVISLGICGHKGARQKHRQQPAAGQAQP